MIITSEQKLPEKNSQKKYIFLAGSIDNRAFSNWRKETIKKLETKINIFDPTNMKHDSLNDSEMESHIIWELDALAIADKILLNFLPDSKSPISLVELGLYAASNKLIVVCPKEFYQSRYVYTLCKKYNTPIFDTINKALVEF